LGESLLGEEVPLSVDAWTKESMSLWTALEIMFVGTANAMVRNWRSQLETVAAWRAASMAEMETEWQCADETRSIRANALPIKVDVVDVVDGGARAHWRPRWAAEVTAAKQA
jgi:hypothetical protein